MHHLPGTALQASGRPGCTRAAPIAFKALQALLLLRCCTVTRAHLPPPRPSNLDFEYDWYAQITPIMTHCHLIQSSGSRGTNLNEFTHHNPYTKCHSSLTLCTPYKKLYCESRPGTTSLMFRALRPCKCPIWQRASNSLRWYLFLPTSMFCSVVSVDEYN